MKKRNFLLLLLGLSMLSFSACGRSDAEDTKDQTDSTVPIESSPVSQSSDTAESSDSTADNNYSAVTTQQDITYLTPDENTELVSISLQALTVSGNESSAIDKINGALNELYKNTYDFITDAEPQEGDLMNNLPASAYEHYSINVESGDEEFFPTYYYATSYSIQRIDDNVFSSQYIADSYSGGAHGSHVVSGINYNMNTGEQITISDLSDDSEAFIGYCTEYLLTLADEMQAEENLFFEYYRDTISDIITDDTFFFSEEGLCFISQEYVLQPYASGTITFCIPYDDLTGYLKEEYFPNDNSWSFETDSVANEPIVYTYQP